MDSEVLTRVNLLSPNHRFVIALLSPSGVFKTGLPRRSSENRATKQAHEVEWDTFSSPVQRQNLQNCADFSRFSGNTGRFLCVPGCVAERAGFEPSVRIQKAIRSLICE
jgi:hypothetical protein